MSKPASLDGIASLLRARASRHAVLGLVIAIVALILATLLAARFQYDSIAFSALLNAQQTNPALWLLDAMPLLFLVWGQYIGVVLSYQAGALVMDETRGLREKTHALEHQLAQSGQAAPILGLPGRGALFSEIGMLRDRGALLVLDCPHYHDLRHSAGTPAAESLLRQIAQRLQSVLRETDYLAQYDQAAFAILVREVRDREDPARLAARLQLALDTPIPLPRGAIAVRVHIGAAFRPEDGDGPEQLLHHAETAKFAATAQSRDYLAYAEHLENEAAEQPRMTAELYAAVSREALNDRYRRQLPLNASVPPRIRQYAQWSHPRRGLLEQSEFLDLPDRPSLAHALLLWQLGHGLTALEEQRAKVAETALAIRVPRIMLAQQDFAATVLRLLSAHDLPATALVLEFTEAALAADVSRAQVSLKTLRSEGVGVSLAKVGDLGTSLAAQLHFPLSEIRLAPDLLRLASEREEARMLLQAHIGLARKQQLRIVAPGAEHEFLLDQARAVACHWAEGAAVPTDD